MEQDTYQPAAGRTARRRVRSAVGHLLPLGITAVLLALAFPEPGWGYLAHVALVPAVIVALRSDNPRRLVWSAYLVSLVWWLVRLSWLTGVTGGGYVALCAYMAVYLPGALLLLRWLAFRYRGAITLLLPMVWISLEWVRGLVLAGGFGWFSLAHTQAAYRPDQSAGWLVQTADLFGPWTVGFIVAMTNGLIVDLLTRPLVRPKRRRGPRYSRTLAAAALLWVIVMAASALYALSVDRENDRPSALRVAVVQTDVPQDNKINAEPGQDETDFARMVELTRQAAAFDPKPHLIVWPETMVPGPLNVEAVGLLAAQPEEHYQSRAGYRARIAELAKELGVALIVGAPAETFEPRYARNNSAFFVSPDGRWARERYDKVHRVPFGEYTPWVESFPAVKRLFIKYLTPLDFDYSIQPGKYFTVFEVADARLAAPICFEDAVPRVTRRMVYDRNGNKRADVLINLTNDGWYPGTHQGPQHVQIAALRCIENRVPMARSVNTGVSGFIDTRGKVGPLVEDENGRRQRVEGVAVADLVIDPRVTLFGRVGQGPVISLAIVTALLGLGGFMRRSKIR